MAVEIMKICGCVILIVIASIFVLGFIKGIVDDFTKPKRDARKLELITEALKELEKVSKEANKSKKKEDK